MFSFCPHKYSPIAQSTRFTLAVASFLATTLADRLLDRSQTHAHIANDPRIAFTTLAKQRKQYTYVRFSISLSLHLWLTSLSLTHARAHGRTTSITPTQRFAKLARAKSLLSLSHTSFSLFFVVKFHSRSAPHRCSANIPMEHGQKRDYSGATGRSARMFCRAVLPVCARNIESFLEIVLFC